MDKIKEPMTLLTVGNTVGLVCIAAYYYKQTEELERKIALLDEKITALSTRQAHVDKELRDKVEGNEFAARALKKLNTEVGGAPNHQLYDDISELYDALAQKDIVVERPSQRPKKQPKKRGGRDRYQEDDDYDYRRPQRSHDKKPKVQYEEDDEEDEDDMVNHVRQRQRQR